MSNTKIKAGQFSGIVGHGTDGFFLKTNGNGTMAWAAASTGPAVTSVNYPGDDLAADPAGNQSVILTGTGFATSGMTVTIGGTTAPAVAHDSTTQLTITTPAKAAGDYDIVVTVGATGASGTFVNGISYNGVPTWTTATGSLGTLESETTISTITLAATEPDGGTITFNITSGALPSGLSLTGANIDGTTTAESSTTLYSFTVEAIDNENQSTPRAFSITVNSAAIVPTDNFTINTYTGTASTHAIEGKIGTAAAFNGSNSKIVLPNSVFSASAFTVAAWCNVTTTGAENSIFEFTDTNSGNNQTMVLLSAGNASNSSRFLIRNTTSNEYSHAPSGTPATGWNHYCLTFDGSTAKSYINGSEVNSASFSITNTIASTSEVLLGLSATDRFLNGKIDQVRIFNTAISSSQVSTLAAESNSSSSISITDIFSNGSGVALYGFNNVGNDTGGASGKFGGSAHFNGSSSKIVVGNSGTIFDAAGGFSASVWVNRNTTANQTILNKEGGVSGSYGWSLRFTSGAGYSYDLYDTSDNQVTVSTGANSTTGNWEHIVISFNNSDNKIRIYYNGGTAVVSSALSSAASSNTENFFIGARTTSGIVTDGRIDQVRIYSAAITDAQANDLYTDETTTTAATLNFPAGAGCIAAYKLNGNANDIVLTQTPTTSATYQLNNATTSIPSNTYPGAANNITYATGNFGNAAVFNGSSSSIDISSSAINPASPYTISMWFNASNASSYEGLYTGISSSPVVGEITILKANATTIQTFSVATNGSNTLNANTVTVPTLSNNTWYNIVVIADRSLTYKSRVFINGVEGTNYTVGSASTNLLSTIKIGFADNNYFDGLIDQVRLFNSSLPQSAVTVLYNETTTTAASASITYESGTYDGTDTNVSYAFDGTPTNVDFVGMSFQPDFVWIKARNNTTAHEIHDSVRGEPSRLWGNENYAASTGLNGFVALTSNGFSLDAAGSGGNVNRSAKNYVSWAWKAGGAPTATNSAGAGNVPTAGSVKIDGSDSTVADAGTTPVDKQTVNTKNGLSITTYTPSGGGYTVSHGFTSAPDLIIVKGVSATEDWLIYNSYSGTGKYLSFNRGGGTESIQTRSNSFSAVTSTTFTDHWTSASLQWVAYCFKNIDGYQKIGSYTGNRPTNVTVTTGFQPRFVLIKADASGEGWVIVDSTRGNFSLYPSTSQIEDAYTGVTFNSTGFVVGNSGLTNTSGTTHIYLAIA